MKFIAPYWIATDITQGEGKICYRMIDLKDNNAQKNEAEIKMLVDEINMATNVLNGEDAKDLSFTEIESLIYLTWENMQPLPNFFTNVSTIFFVTLGFIVKKPYLHIYSNW